VHAIVASRYTNVSTMHGHVLHLRMQKKRTTKGCARLIAGACIPCCYHLTVIISLRVKTPTSYSWSVNSSCVDRIEIDLANNHKSNKICGQIICLVEVARVLISD
jgi:hypothetical protein